MRRIVFLSLVFCCSMIDCSMVDAQSPESSDLTRRVQKSIIEQTNEFRTSKGLDSLRREDHLMECAKDFARFMADTGKYGHRADGQSPAERAEAAGYHYCVVRENIAYRTNSGEVTEESLVDVFVQGWIDSPPHLENILADYVTETGVSVATSDGVTYYAVQVFGRPESAALKIELTNKTTDQMTVVFTANDQKESLELAPRMVARMTRCLPTRVSLKGKDQSVNVVDDTTMTITDDGLVASPAEEDLSK